MLISIITPTHARPKAFQLCEKYMARQTYKGDIQWLVVIDAGINDYNFTMGQQVINRDTSNDVASIHSVNANYLEALPHIKGDKVAFVEDDDWYNKDYLQTLSDALDTVDLAGFASALYYHVTARRWRDMKNTGHCSLAATGITRNALPTFKQACLVPWCKYADMCLWTHHKLTGTWKILPNEVYNPSTPNMPPRPIHVGIKGLKDGCPGVGMGHDATAGIRDGNFRVLRQWIGLDVKNYQ
jgi:hypothetical protein